MRAGALLLFSLWAAAAAASVQAQAPMSAIDWLSDTARNPAGQPARGAKAPPGGTAQGEAPVTSSAAVADVTVSQLATPGAGVVGVLSPDQTGLPQTLWSGSKLIALEGLLSRLRPSRLPAINDLVVMLMLAEAGPALASDGEALLLARVDQLLARGALEQAGALLQQAGPGPGERFRRAFDVALLTGQEDRACADLRQRPGIRPTYPLRVFCLARTGDWSAAALTLDAASVLGEVTTEDDTLLVHFLDPEMGADLPIPKGMRPTPLTFRILDAIGEPLPTGPLPIAFAQSDLRPSVGWKAQIEAAERLTRAGAIPPGRLFELYTRNKPSASGGVWDRVAAVQALDGALGTGDPAAVAAALNRAWPLMQEAGLESALADQTAARLIALDLPGAAASLAYRMALLTPLYETAARHVSATGRSNDKDSFLAGLARGAPEKAAAYDEASAAIAAAFTDRPVPEELAAMARSDRLGEAILRAAEMIGNGTSGDLSQMAGALAFLRSVGLESTARRAALQALILQGGG